MLTAIADDCRRWTSAASIELVLVVPIIRGEAGLALAAVAGNDDCVDRVTDRILRVALAVGADQAVIAHNHLVTSPPGSADLAVTRRLVAAFAVIGIPLLAHLVVTPGGWFDCFDESLLLTGWADAVAA